MTKFYVDICEVRNDKVDKTMGPFSKRTAEKVAAGVEVNLNTEDFYVDIDERETREKKQ